MKTTRYHFINDDVARLFFAKALVVRCIAPHRDSSLAANLNNLTQQDLCLARSFCFPTRTSLGGAPCWMIDRRRKKQDWIRACSLDRTITPICKRNNIRNDPCLWEVSLVVLSDNKLWNG